MKIFVNTLLSILQLQKISNYSYSLKYTKLDMIWLILSSIIFVLNGREELRMEKSRMFSILKDQINSFLKNKMFLFFFQKKI